jgi:hypothetical protein
MVRTLMVILSLLIATFFPVFAQYYPRSYQGTPEEQQACRPDGHACAGAS